MNQYPSYPIQLKSIPKRNIWYVLIICFVLVFFIVGYVILLPKAVCGNKVCEKDENCITCREDCSCPAGKYCSEKTKSCVAPICGNGVCELFETPAECCRDCDCYPGAVCNQKLNLCEKKEFGLTDERVKEIIGSYYNSLGKKVVSIDIADIVNVGNKIGRRAIVNFENEEEWKAVIVTEDEKIIEEEKIG
jgi:hypothetical protein